MTSRLAALRATAFLTAPVGVVLPWPPGQAAAPAPSASGTRADGSLLIVENAGQFDPAVRFQARVGGTTLWVTDTSLWITRIEDAEPTATPEDGQGGNPNDPEERRPRRGVHLELAFPGHGADARAVAWGPLPTRMNYLLGSDPGRWRRGVRTWGAVSWSGLYPGISLRLGGAGGEPALVVEAAPGADRSALRLRVAGADSVRASPEGGVVADTAIGAVPLPPVVHDGRPLAPSIRGAEVSFGGVGPASGAGAEPLVLAVPVGKGLRYGTFLGGAQDEGIGGVAVGRDGSTFVAGWTYSPDFPTTPGAFDTTYDEGGFGGDAFVSRLDPTGSTLAYSTFLGGSDSDFAGAMAVDTSGAVYVGGYTLSTDFPTTPGSFDPTFNGVNDAFLTKLNPEGTDLVYSTFLGGSDSNESIDAMTVAADGTAYLTGDTRSADFPTAQGAYDTTYNGGGDAFVTVLNPEGTDLVYSTFLGGDHGDHGYGIALGPDGTASVTGETQSRDFPTTPGAFDQTFNGGNNDLFVARLNQAGTALVFSTYIGGGDSDDGAAIVVDPGGNAYVTGDTLSFNYPTTPGAYDTTKDPNFPSDAVVTKLSPDGTDLVYSTFLGGSEYETGADLVLERDGALTLVGRTMSPNFPTTLGAYDRTLGGSGDAFVARFDPTGSDLVYGSYLGGTDIVVEYGTAIVLARPGVVTVAGRTHSRDFPTTPGAYDRTFNGGWDGFVATLRVARAVHVERIVPGYREEGTGYRVGAAVRIVDFRGTPVEGAAVTVEVDLPGGEAVVVTRPTGQVGIAVVAALTHLTGIYTFTVLDVSEPGSVYDPTHNAETTDSVTIP